MRTVLSIGANYIKYLNTQENIALDLNILK